MIGPATVLAGIPSGLRNALLAEYQEIVQHYMDRKWRPSELSGGRYCEVVFTILDGYAKGAYATRPKKPSNMVDACRELEAHTAVPRSFQILIPRALPVLYEIRNNRNVGHVGGDVDPNHMDSTAVLMLASWIMAELVRVFHGVSVDHAQQVVDALVERRVPLVWQSDGMKRVLDPKLPLQDQVLILIASCAGKVRTDLVFTWTGYKTRAYFDRLLRQLHSKRFVELTADSSEVQMLPPGFEYVDARARTKAKGRG